MFLNKYFEINIYKFTLSFEVHIAPNYNFGQYVKIRNEVKRFYVL